MMIPLERSPFVLLVGLVTIGVGYLIRSTPPHEVLGVVVFVVGVILTAMFILRRMMDA